MRAGRWVAGVGVGLTLSLLAFATGKFAGPGEVFLLLIVGLVVGLRVIPFSKWKISKAAFALGVILGLLLFLEWYFDLSGWGLRTRTLLALHIRQQEEHARELWDQVSLLVDRSRDPTRPGVQVAAKATLKLSLFGIGNEWDLKGYDLSGLARKRTALLWWKRDPNFARGRPVVSLLKVDLNAIPDADAIVGELDAALIQIEDAMQKYGADIGTITYAFELPQNNSSMEELVKTLAEKYADTRAPIAIAWRDEGGRDHVVCIGCNDPFTLMDVAKQACEQKGICVNEADDAVIYVGIGEP